MGEEIKGKLKHAFPFLSLSGKKATILINSEVELIWSEKRLNFVIDIFKRMSW